MFEKQTAEGSPMPMVLNLSTEEENILFKTLSFKG